MISYWIIFEKFQSPSLAGFTVIAHWVPFLLCSIWAGALADRYDPRRIIQAGMVLFMLVSVGWEVLFATDSLEKWHAVVLLIVHGLAGVLWAPAGQVLVHDVVGGRQLQSAIRLLATSRTLGLLLGPAAGGALLLIVGPTWGIFINVLIYLPLTLADPQPERVNTNPNPTSAAMTSFRDMFDTVRKFRHPGRLRDVVSRQSRRVFIGNAHEPQMPEFLNLGYGGEGLYYSMLLTANAVGALMAGIILEAGNMLPAKTRTSFILGLLWALAILGFAVSQTTFSHSFCLPVPVSWTCRSIR